MPTAFDPRLHGFHFVNAFHDDLIPIGNGGLFDCYGRCGGMVYGALDYFYAGQQTDTLQTSMPPRYTPFDKYIWDRQVNSALDAVDKWLIMPLQPDEQLWRWMKTDEQRKIVSSIDSGRPVPLGLISKDGFSKDHHVVAFDYSSGPGTFELTIYDPNMPDQRPTITLQDGALGCTHSNGTSWRMFFVKEAYGPVDPVFPP